MRPFPSRQAPDEACRGDGHRGPLSPNPRQEVPMSRIVFVNGSFVPYEEAKIPIMDRGFLFADGIYEVSAVLSGRLVDHEAHLARLDRSLREIRIPNPYRMTEWTELCRDLVRRNQ